MTEGLFWLICYMDDDAINWNEEWEIYYLFAKSDSISHKDAWTRFAQSEKSVFGSSNMIIFHVDVL